MTDWTRWALTDVGAALLAGTVNADPDDQQQDDPNPDRFHDDGGF